MVFRNDALTVLRIGLTGGIASGKSAAASRFAASGATVIDTDAIAREVVEPGQAALTTIGREFGPGTIDAAGRLDRGKLRRRIFNDLAAKRRLERILHPLIRKRTLELAAQAAGPYVVIAVPLLVETDFSALVDRVLVVDCAPEVQISRLMERDNMTESEAKAALGAQTDRATRLAAADDLIDNSGDFERLNEQVDRLHTRYVAMTRDCPKS